ncbi:pilM; PilM [Oxalobacteraceae bacterium IMCC9480]|nr:pilM; PilM [Oxalobacteraceae bacterium IMCC9480]
MWIIAIITIIASLTGYASMTSQIALTRVADAARVTSLAANMASYRTGVVNYVNANPGTVGTVSAPAFPTGYVALNPPQWTNTVLNGGTIAVYSIGVSPPGLIKGLSALAQHSVMAGRANTASGRIEAPGTPANDQIPLPALTGITNGAAIWLAHRD